jgi:O-antigen ligase
MQISSLRIQDLGVWLERNHAWLLVLLAVLLFSTKTLFLAPMLLLALLGAYRLVRARGALVADPAIQLMLALFACLWLPQLLALPDAVAPEHTLQTVLPDLGFLLMGVYIISAAQERDIINPVSAGVCLIAAFWCADALLQFFTGEDLFGYPQRKGQLAGMFYPKLRLGHLLAVLAPLCFEWIRRHQPRHSWSWLLLIPLIAVIFLSGKRVAWLMLGVATAGYLLYLGAVLRAFRPRVIAVAALGTLGTLATLYLSHEPFENRFDVALGLFSGNTEQADRAAGRRFDLWATAARMALDHPINGLGPRGYRHVYPEYAETEDFWMRDGRQGQTHPHLFLLEIAAETGGVGLLGYVLFWYLLWQALRKAPPLESGWTWPWALVLATALFPLNAHLAFYGTYWTALIWLSTALTVAALRR